MKVIRCDCGFEAAADGDAELLSRARAHARDVHGTELPADLVIGDGLSAPGLGVEGVAEAVADEVHGQHGQEDGQPGRVDEVGQVGPDGAP